jgi:signal transduction histidine kinase
MRRLEIAAAFLAVTLIGVLDYATGPYVSVSIFYLLIILWGAWRLGAPLAYFLAIGEGIVSLIATISDPIAFPINLFNISARVLVFLLVAYLASRLRTTLDAEREQKRQLAEANRQKDLFLGIAAHDLRNPIGVIKMGSSLLMQGKPAKERDRLELAKRIHDSSGFMLRLVDDLLDISKIESGSLTLRKTDVSYTALVRDTVHLAETFAAPKRIKIRLAMPKDEIRLFIDEDKIKQVLNNLLSNAIAYSPPGSMIRVSVERGVVVRTAVADEGPGVSEEEASYIFNVFARGKAKGTAGEKSTGLGLPIVKRIVEGHGGTIGVSKGEGAIFHFTLPV